MPKKPEEEIRQITPFDIYRNLLPKGLPRAPRILVEQTHKFLREARPATITLAVTTGYRFRPPRDIASPQGSPDCFRLYVFGTFRKSYTAITRIADALAPMYLEMHVLPLVTPVLRREFHDLNWEESRMVQRIRRDGLITYNQD